MEKNTSNEETKTKSLDELFQKKSKKLEKEDKKDSEDLRQKMNRVVDANKVFEDEAVPKNINQEEYDA